MIQATSPILTSCKDCVFAVYSGVTQTGCQLGRIDIYQNRGDVLEAYDDEREFFVLKDSLCLAKRNQEWATKHQGENLVSLVEKSLAYMNYEVLVFVDNDLENLQKTIDSIVRQSLKPARIVFVNKPPLVNPEMLIQIANNTGLEWRIENVVDSDLFDEECIDLVITHSPHSFYGVCHSGFEYPIDTFQKISRAINIKLQRFSYIRPIGKNGLFMSRAIHRAYAGSSFGRSLLNKIDCDSNNPMSAIDLQDILNVVE